MSAPVVDLRITVINWDPIGWMQSIRRDANVGAYVTSAPTRQAVRHQIAPTEDKELFAEYVQMLQQCLLMPASHHLGESIRSARCDERARRLICPEPTALNGDC